MVWKEYMDEVITGLHAYAPFASFTQKAAFRAVTSAQHDLQMATGAIRHDMDLSVDSLITASGSIPVGGLLHIIDRAEIILPGETVPYREVTVTDNEGFQAIVRRQQCMPDRSPYVITLVDTNILLYPYTYPSVGVGTIRLHYQPKLKPYSDTETEAWPNYADSAQFATLIRSQGPEPRFDNAAQEGLIAGAILKLLNRVPGIRQELGQEAIDELKLEWMKAIESVEVNNVSYAMTAQPAGYFTPVR